MGDISERDPGRIATLAHAVLAVAVRGDASGIPRYDSDELATLWEAGNLDKAAAYLDGFFLNNGGRPRIWSDAAVILADAGMIDEALNCVRRAISCDPFHEAARENLWYLLERPRTEEPERLCLLEMDPALAVQNVETLMSIGREEGALNWAETAFMRRPDATSAAALVRVLRALNRPSQAGEVSSLLRLLAAGRTDPSVPPQH
jgi:tetratricopeptide (TPR) repeat protein